MKFTAVIGLDSPIT